MLVTQVEIFIEHLIDVILLADPRRLKDLAGDKQLTSTDIVDAQDYQTVMGLLRAKVAKGVIGSNTRDMLEKHLGDKFELFEKQSLKCATMKEEGGNKETWDIAKLITIWETRHEIVHEGRLDITRQDFDSAAFGCAWLESFLSRRAQDVFGLAVESDRNLKLISGLFEKPTPNVLGLLLTQWATIRLLDNVRVKRT